MGGKQILLTRQDSLLSSSSRRKARPDDRAHAPACSVGCVSNILHLFSKYHTRRKFLTSGKKQEKSVILPPSCSKEEREHNNNYKLVLQTSKKQANTSASVEQEEHDHHNYGEKKTHYSPSSESATPTPTRPAVVVARLMGLDGFPSVPASSESASAKKREELLRGLEKCDQDLRSLKKIIEALRSDTAKHDDQRRPSQFYYSTSSSSPPAPGGVILKSNKEARQLDCHEQPSPDSVLHQFTPPSPPPHAAVACFANQRSNGTTIQRRPRKKPREEGYRINFTSINKWREENVASTFSYRHSKAMGESVEESCHNVAWGEKREAKRIGLALKEGIWKDLIEEIVKEMGCLSRLIHYLPSARCRRRLSL